MTSPVNNLIPWIWFYSIETPYGKRYFEFRDKILQTCVVKQMRQPTPIHARRFYPIGSSKWSYNSETRNFEISADEEKVALAICQYLKHSHAVSGAGFLWIRPLAQKPIVVPGNQAPQKSKKPDLKIEIPD